MILVAVRHRALPVVQAPPAERVDPLAAEADEQEERQQLEVLEHDGRLDVERDGPGDPRGSREPGRREAEGEQEGAGKAGAALQGQCAGV